jgi:hypothetical protein
MTAPDFAPARPTSVTVTIEPSDRRVWLHMPTHAAIVLSPADARQVAELLLRAADSLAEPGEDADATEFGT